MSKPHSENTESVLAWIEKQQLPFASFNAAKATGLSTTAVCMILLPLVRRGILQRTGSRGNYRYIRQQSDGDGAGSLKEAAGYKPRNSKGGFAAAISAWIDKNYGREFTAREITAQLRDTIPSEVINTFLFAKSRGGLLEKRLKPGAKRSYAYVTSNRWPKPDGYQSEQKPAKPVPVPSVNPAYPMARQVLLKLMENALIPHEDWGQPQFAPQGHPEKTAGEEIIAFEGINGGYVVKIGLRRILPITNEGQLWEVSRLTFRSAVSGKGNVFSSADAETIRFILNLTQHA